MTIHRYHPDPEANDPEDAILWDDCERCSEHASQLTSLDASHCRALVALVSGVEIDGMQRYRTRAEMTAGRLVWHAALVIATANRSTPYRVLLGLEP